MGLATWLCLAVFLVAIAGSTALAVVRGLRAWRAFRSFSSSAAEAVDDVVARAGAAERQASTIAGGAARLGAATRSLHASAAELSVLREAAGEVQALLAGLRGGLPRR